MFEQLAIKDPREIPVILDVIHDCWFHKDEIRFNRESATLIIPFGKPAEEERAGRRGWRLKKADVPIIRCYLNIHNAVHYRIEDSAKVGIYDFDRLKYDPLSRRVSITTGVPINIEVDVEKFEISVEITNLRVPTSSS